MLRTDVGACHVISVFHSYAVLAGCGGRSCQRRCRQGQDFAESNGPSMMRRSRPKTTEVAYSTRLLSRLSRLPLPLSVSSCSCGSCLSVASQYLLSWLQPWGSLSLDGCSTGIMRIVIASDTHESRHRGSARPHSLSRCRRRALRTHLRAGCSGQRGMVTSVADAALDQPHLSPQPPLPLQPPLVRRFSSSRRRCSLRGAGLPYDAGRRMEIDARRSPDYGARRRLNKPE